MKTILRLLLTCVVLFVGFECMVHAFHLLNEPSDRAVYMGMAALMLLGIFLPITLFQLWRQRK